MQRWERSRFGCRGLPELRIAKYQLPGDDSIANRASWDASLSQVRITAEELREFAREVLRSVGMSEEDATVVGNCLVDVDLRGVKSHGTRQLKRYVREFQEGELNPTPKIRTLKASPNSVVLDGTAESGIWSR